MHAWGADFGDAYVLGASAPWGRGTLRALGPTPVPEPGSPPLLRAGPGSRPRPPIALWRRERPEPAEPPPAPPARPAPFDTHSPANMAAGRGRAGCVCARAGPALRRPGPAPRPPVPPTVAQAPPHPLQPPPPPSKTPRRLPSGHTAPQNLGRNPLNNSPNPHSRVPTVPSATRTLANSPPNHALGDFHSDPPQIPTPLHILQLLHTSPPSLTHRPRHPKLTRDLTPAVNVGTEISWEVVLGALVTPGFLSWVRGSKVFTL